MKTIKIFLGSSINELHYERLHLSDYLMTNVRPLFQNDGVELELIKSENMDLGVLGRSSQNDIDTLIRKCDISIFLFKTKAGDIQIHEFNVARELQKQKKKKHDIYVFCFEVPTEEKKQSLKEFQKRLAKEESYWYACKDINDLEAHFIIGLLNYERQLLKITKPSVVEQESETEKNGEVLYSNYLQEKQKKEDLREKIQKDIEDLMQQTETVMANKNETIAARIFKVKELYQKADQWAEATDYDKKKYSVLLFDYARFLCDYNLYNDAERILLRQIPLTEEIFGKEDIRTAASYNEIGLVYHRLGEYEKALMYHFKALAIEEKVLGTEHPTTASSYNNIGAVYNEQGDYDKALDYYLKALAIKEKVLDTKHPDTASSYNNIGAVYKEQGDYEKALEYYLKALAIKEKVLGTEHPTTASSYNNISAVYKEQGNYEKALEYYLKALAIVEKNLGLEHPYIASSYNNIGEVYKGQGNYGKALEYYLKALAIKEKILGTEHPDTASSYNNIGTVYKEQGDYDKALEYCFKALSIREKILGKDHPDTAKSYNSLGEIYRLMYEYNKALEFFYRSLAIREKILGTMHPDTIISYINIGKTYYNLKEYKRALEYLNKAYYEQKNNIGQKYMRTKSTREESIKEMIEMVKVEMGLETNSKMPFWKMLWKK